MKVRIDLIQSESKDSRTLDDLEDILFGLEEEELDIKDQIDNITDYYDEDEVEGGIEEAKNELMAQLADVRSEIDDTKKLIENLKD